MRYLVCLLAIMLSCSCGEDKSCDKLMSIWQEICTIPEGQDYPCFPCSCALCGRHWEFKERLGVPDIALSSCQDMGSCEGATRTFAKTCLEHVPEDLKQPIAGAGWIENECDPRYSYGIWLCDSAESFNPAFPEVAAKGVETYDCGE